MTTQWEYSANLPPAVADRVAAYIEDLRLAADTGKMTHHRGAEAVAMILRELRPVVVTTAAPEGGEDE
jgi:hypothetical protein